MFENLRNAFNNVAEDVSQRFDDVSRRFDQNRPNEHGTNDRSAPVAAQARRRPTQQTRTSTPTPAPAPLQRAPPASMKAIKKLPTIRVAPEDLIDPNNRECCICLEENKLDDLVTRLPCAHIFHTHCIIDWLSNHSCTCPVCRYELPTDYPQYEEGRIERMKLRKPRYAMHELKRMAVSDLLELNRRPLSGAFEKKDLIQSLIDNDWIDIIPAPEPVQYELEVLKNMKIGQLKRAMAEAGVFFRKEDVLMKSDMITVFENSGRLVLIYTDSDQSTNPLDNFETMVHATPETGHPNPAESPSNLDITIGSTMDFEEDDEVLVETVNDDSEDLDRNAALHEEVVEMFPSQNEEVIEESEDQTSAASDTHNSMQAETQTRQHAGRGNVAVSEEIPIFNRNRNDTAAGSEIQSVAQGSRQMDIEDIDLSAIVDLTSTDLDLRSTYDHYTISHLQTLGKDLQVDLSHCLMRKEMIDIFVNAGITGNLDPLVLSPLIFSTWSVSQLRVVASEMKVSLSECTNKEQMVERILHAGNTERPYLRDYLRSLTPLTRKSLSDLRAIARELQINIRDCLEKDEIIQRLISRGRRVEESS